MPTAKPKCAHSQGYGKDLGEKIRLSSFWLNFCMRVEKNGRIRVKKSGTRFGVRKYYFLISLIMKLLKLREKYEKKLETRWNFVDEFL